MEAKTARVGVDVTQTVGLQEAKTTRNMIIEAGGQNDSIGTCVSGYQGVPGNKEEKKEEKKGRDAKDCWHRDSCLTCIFSVSPSDRRRPSELLNTVHGDGKLSVGITVLESIAGPSGKESGC
jgi:hypothetical protein